MNYLVLFLSVLSSHIKWLPIGNQASKVISEFYLFSIIQLLFLILTQFKIIFKFKSEDVASMYDDILIAKLNPGQV